MTNLVAKQVCLSWEGKQINYLLNLDPTLAHEVAILKALDTGMPPEVEVAFVMMRGLREGDVALDVGANIGFFTLLMSKLVGKSGHVVAYEPGPNNLPALNRNVTLNGALNVSLSERPVWCKEQEIIFHLNADNRSSNSVYDPGAWYDNILSRGNPQSVVLYTTTLDLAPCSHDKIRLIKIDAEGADMRVLEGSANLLADHHPAFVIVEFNPFAMNQAKWTVEECREYMHTLGYSLFFLHENGSMPSLVGPRTKVVFLGGTRCINVMFSTLDAVAQAWPEAYG